MNTHQTEADTTPNEERQTSQRFMTEKEAAHFLGFAPKTLSNWRVTGDGPAYFQINRSIRYKPQHLVDWATEKYCVSTSDYCEAPSKSNENR